MHTTSSFTQLLRAALFRFDCPSPLLLGEYALDLRRDPERSQVAQHALCCPECQAELRTLRAFLVEQPTAAEPTGLRRVLASLFTPVHAPALRAARGAQPGHSVEYRAGPVTVVLGVVPGRRRDTVGLDGLVLHAEAAADAIADLSVSLLQEDAEAAVLSTRTDELGNFAFDAIPIGVYGLEIELADEIVLIEDVQLGARI